MPQFELANFAPQMVWLCIAFAILFFGIVMPTLPKLGRVVQARADKVSGDIDSAAKAKADADRIEADYAAGIATAQESARATLDTARGHAAAALEAKLAQSKATLDARADEADKALAAARTKATGEIERVAADAAAEIVEKLTGTRPDADTATGAARVALAA